MVGSGYDNWSTRHTAYRVELNDCRWSTLEETPLLSGFFSLIVIVECKCGVKFINPKNPIVGIKFGRVLGQGTRSTQPPTSVVLYSYAWAYQSVHSPKLFVYSNIKISLEVLSSRWYILFNIPSFDITSLRWSPLMLSPTSFDGYTCSRVPHLCDESTCGFITTWLSRGMYYHSFLTTSGEVLTFWNAGPGTIMIIIAHQIWSPPKSL